MKHVNVLGAALRLAILLSGTVPIAANARPPIVIPNDYGDPITVATSGPNAVKGAVALAQKILSLDQQLKDEDIPPSKIALLRSFRDAAAFELESGIYTATHTSAPRHTLPDGNQRSATDALHTAEGVFRCACSSPPDAVTTHITCQQPCPSLAYVTLSRYLQSDHHPDDSEWTQYSDGQKLSLSAYEFRARTAVGEAVHTCIGTVSVWPDPTSSTIPCQGW